MQTVPTHSEVSTAIVTQDSLEMDLIVQVSYYNICLLIAKYFLLFTRVTNIGNLGSTATIQKNSIVEGYNLVAVVPFDFIIATLR